MDETIIRILEQLPLGGSIGLVFYLLGKKLLGIWERQLKGQSETTRSILKLFGEITSSIQALSDELKQIKEDNDEERERMSVFFAVLNETTISMQKRLNTAETQTKEQWQKVTEVGQGLKTDMSQVKDGNQEILIELRELTTQVKRLADTMQKINWEQFAAMPENINTAMESVTNTVAKLSEPKPVIKPEDKTNA